MLKQKWIENKKINYNKNILKLLLFFLIILILILIIIIIISCYFNKKIKTSNSKSIDYKDVIVNETESNEERKQIFYLLQIESGISNTMKENFKKYIIDAKNNYIEYIDMAKDITHKIQDKYGGV